MSNPVPKPTPVPSANGNPDKDKDGPKPAVAAVIRRIQGAEETPNQRLLRKHIPAWVISGAVHVALIATLILIDKLMPKSAAGPATDEQLTVVTDDKPQDEKQPDLTNPDIGLDPELPSVVNVENLSEVNVDTKVNANEAIGLPDSVATKPVDVIPPPGVSATEGTGGLEGTTGAFMSGSGAGGEGAVMGEGFRGRNAATKSRLLATGGGNSASEAAVARGLIWLAKQQKANGSWVYDGSSSGDTIAATGMSLLPFLAAGQTHKPAKDNKYQKNVEAGVAYLLQHQQANGSFKGSSGMYSHAIATVALCELYGMTGDRAKLHATAAKAVSFIVSVQGNDGSWGYPLSKADGDTSIVGWQIQALHSGRMCKDILVPNETFVNASKFLDSVSDSSKKSTYGYRDRNSIRPSLTAVGLLSRYYGDKWGPNNPGMAAGVGYLMKNWMPNNERFDMYYYYYATQVAHFYDGPEWQEWNAGKNGKKGMRDILIDRQVAEGKGANSGSWDPDTAMIGSHCGRLGTTCLALLTLEVYYRHLPLYKRDTGGLRELERNR